MRSELIDVRTHTSSLSSPRIGIIVPRFGRTVVERNRLRRRLRELVRILLLPVLNSQDVLLRASPAAYRVPFEALRREMRVIADTLATAER